MAGRFTGDNTRLIYDVLFKANQQKKKGLLVLIDFEKAFDSISWQFMNTCLVFFNFGEPFRQWIKLFTSDIKSCVQINGMISSWLPVGRGCRQGDPISPYLFLICSKILAHIIRKDPDIKGYLINDIEIKVSQFSVDSSLFLDGSREALRKWISVLLKFSTFSGLKMNLDKTKCAWFGWVRSHESIVLHEVNIEWNPEKCTVLGVEFTTDLKEITRINLKKKIESIQRELHQWTKRNLIPIGKITAIQSLMLAKIVNTDSSPRCRHARD